MCADILKSLAKINQYLVKQSKAFFFRYNSDFQGRAFSITCLKEKYVYKSKKRITYNQYTYFTQQ